MKRDKEEIKVKRRKMKEEKVKGWRGGTERKKVK